MYKGHAFKSFKPSIDTTLFESYFDKSAFKLNWPIIAVKLCGDLNDKNKVH